MYEGSLMSIGTVRQTKICVRRNVMLGNSVQKCIIV